MSGRPAARRSRFHGDTLAPESALGGACAFIEGMRELDEATLYVFADSLRSRTRGRYVAD